MKKSGLVKQRKRCRTQGQHGRQAAVLAVMTTMILGLSGCGSSSKSYDTANEAVVEYSSIAEAKSEETGVAEVLSDGNVASRVSQENRKLIKTVSMDVETKEFDTMLEGLTAQIRECGGYVESMNTYNGSAYSSRLSTRSASMTIRIPEDKLDAFLGAVTQISNVVRRNDSVEDVTLTYVDLQSHKEALQTEQTRLLELLEKAESVEDIITIEERLSDVRYQIESMESQLRTYDNLISYSTVNLDIEEVKELTPVKEETVWERISGGFVESLHSVGDGFLEFGIWMIVNSPFLFSWAAIIIVIFWLLCKINKRRRNRKAMEGTYKAAAQYPVQPNTSAAEPSENAEKH